MSMKHLWKDTEEGNLKCFDRNPSQCHFAHHKFHIVWPGIKSGPLEMKVGNRLPQKFYGAMQANNAEKLKKCNERNRLDDPNTCGSPFVLGLSEEIPSWRVKYRYKVCTIVCVCVCVTERERERESELHSGTLPRLWVRTRQLVSN